MLTDTIAAISTGGISSSINIIRISGDKAVEIVKSIFTGADKIGHQKIVYGKITNTKNEIIDEVLVSCFLSPNSYTGEDICEINCHGGKANTLLVLEEAISHGARIAEPGEFSKRAYINGKMDLSKAEAIVNIINAKTKAQVKIASAELDGNIKNKITEIRENLIDLMAHIEVSIDYPEYNYEEISNEELTNKILNSKEKIEQLIKEGNEGRYVKEGVRIAILGKTNSGKSSLLNKLVGEDKAIVTDIEGTTRDIVEDTIIINNLVINIVDTAGIRKSEDIVENIGIQRSLSEIEKADAIIYVIDSTIGKDAEDIENLEKIEKAGKPVFCCYNKVDISREKIANNTDENIYISTLTKEGIEPLKEKIVKKFETIDMDDIQEKVIVNERQKMLLVSAKENIEKALEKIKKNVDIDIVETDIKEGNYFLGEIIGENHTGEVIEQIFKKFCLGK